MTHSSQLCPTNLPTTPKELFIYRLKDLAQSLGLPDFAVHDAALVQHFEEEKIMQIPLVAQLLMLFIRKFLPATMAALLGEKERAA
jgi:hypothetical protein